MKKQAFRLIVITCGLLVVAAVPAQAGPVTLTDVVQVISGNPRYSGQAANMELRYSPQEDKTQKSDGNALASTTSSQQTGDVATQQDPPQDTQSGNVQAQTEEVAEITTTDCECGELPDEIVEIPGGRSKWPFVPLVGLICVTGICTTDSTPTPTPPEVPEPATLLLFGSGLAALGAGARRRYARAKLAKQINATEGQDTCE